MVTAVIRAVTLATLVLLLLAALVVIFLSNYLVEMQQEIRDEVTLVKDESWTTRMTSSKNKHQAQKGRHVGTGIYCIRTHR
jgi:sensor domain CHASE-containing protein